MDKKINLCGIENCKYNKNKICCLTRDPSVCFTNLCEIAKRDKQIADLETKLAEKEKEIEYLNSSTVSFDLFESVVEHADQDKISFAVARLEEVKDLIERKIDNGSVYVSLDWLYDVIRLKIKTLNEGKGE